MLRYPGGKSKLKKKIIPILKKLGKDCGFYIEPFIGGGSIFCEYLKTQPTNVLINDRDYGVSSFWTSLINQPDALKDKILAYKPSVDDFYRFKDEMKKVRASPRFPRMLEVGFKTLVLHQVSYSGLGVMAGGPIGGANQKSKYKVDCRWNPETICKNIDETLSLIDKVHLKFYRCLNTDFSEFLRIEDAIIYLDPPYFDKGDELYRHGFAGRHKELALKLRECPSNWLLSYDDCTEIKELYSWAHIKPVVVSHTMRITDSNKGEKKSELLISNLPI